MAILGGIVQPLTRLTVRAGEPTDPRRQCRCPVEHLADPPGVEVVADAVSALQPGFRPRPAAVTGVRTGHLRLAQPMQDVPVVGTERDRDPRHPAAGEVSEHPEGVVDLPPGRVGVHAPPVAMRPTVRPDRHAGTDQLPHARGVDTARFAELAGQHEELRGQPALEQPGQTDLQVRHVPVVERDPHVRPADHGVQQLLELRDAHPRNVLTRRELTVGRADAVHGEVRDQGRHQLELPPITPRTIVALDGVLRHPTAGHGHLVARAVPRTPSGVCGSSPIGDLGAARSRSGMVALAHSIENTACGVVESRWHPSGGCVLPALRSGHRFAGPRPKQRCMRVRHF